MKTIIHVVQHLSPGGLETMVLDMLEFTQPEHQIMVVSLEGTLKETLSHWARLERYKNQIICLNKQSGFSLNVVNKLRTIVNKLNVDVMHSHHIGPLLYVGCATLFNKKITHIHTEHDAWHLNVTKHRYLQRAALSIAKPKLVADAKFVQQSLSNIFHQYPIHTIKNGINPYKFKQGNKRQAQQILGITLPKRVKVVGNAARLETVKGQANLIEAFRFLDASHHLLLAGSGSQKTHLQKLVQKYDLENRIHFLGHIDHMPTFYQALDIFCLPSHNEGFPLSILEAQSCGIACVANNVGGVRETLCPDSSVLLSDNQPATLSQGIHALLHQKIGSSPRDFILQNNHAKTMASAYEVLYFQGVSV